MRLRYRDILLAAATVLSAIGHSASLTGHQGPVGGTRIRGWTLSVDGRPLADVEVALACPPLPAQRIMSDASGGFEFLSPEANCRLIARKDGYVAATFDGEDGRGGYGIAVRTTSIHDGIELRLARAGAITGIISAPNGELPVGLRFQVVRRDVVNGIEKLVALSYAPVRQNGRFTASGLPPADYYVVASPAPYGTTGTFGGFAVTYFPGTSRLSDATVIAVKAGERREANFQLVTASTFNASGLVYDAAGTPLSDIAVGVSFDGPPHWIRAPPGREVTDASRSAVFRTAATCFVPPGRPPPVATRSARFTSTSTARMCRILPCV